MGEQQHLRSYLARMKVSRWASSASGGGRAPFGSPGKVSCEKDCSPGSSQTSRMTQAAQGTHRITCLPRARMGGVSPALHCRDLLVIPLVELHRARPRNMYTHSSMHSETAVAQEDTMCNLQIHTWLRILCAPPANAMARRAPTLPDRFARCCVRVKPVASLGNRSVAAVLRILGIPRRSVAGVPSSLRISCSRGASGGPSAAVPSSASLGIRVVVGVPVSSCSQKFEQGCWAIGALPCLLTRGHRLCRCEHCKHIVCTVFWVGCTCSRLCPVVCERACL